MSGHRFTQVGVVTHATPLGNPLAVVQDADSLDDARMRAARPKF